MIDINNFTRQHKDDTKRILDKIKNRISKEESGLYKLILDKEL